MEFCFSSLVFSPLMIKSPDKTVPAEQFPPQSFCHACLSTFRPDPPSAYFRKHHGSLSTLSQLFPTLLRILAKRRLDPDFRLFAPHLKALTTKSSKPIGCKETFSNPHHRKIFFLRIIPGCIGKCIHYFHLRTGTLNLFCHNLHDLRKIPHLFHSFRLLYDCLE